MIGKRMSTLLQETENARLPTFESPPVTEVALSVQFAELGNLRAIHLSLLWEKFGKTAFPTTEEQPPVANAVESTGSSSLPNGPQIQFLDLPPLPRVLFISQDGNIVIQVQADRFTVNWRKRKPTDLYPRYEAVENAFVDNFLRFQNFIAEEGLGTARITQAEITYVNRIDVDEHPGRLEKVVSVFSGAYSDTFLHDPEEVHLSLRYPMKSEGKTVGRLYIDIRPGTYSGRDPAMSMILIARGKPIGDGIKASQDFFAVARKYIVSAFASVTSKQMHLVWKRREDA